MDCVLFIILIVEEAKHTSDQYELAVTVLSGSGMVAPGFGIVQPVYITSYYCDVKICYHCGTNDSHICICPCVSIAHYYKTITFPLFGKVG